MCPGGRWLALIVLVCAFVPASAADVVAESVGPEACKGCHPAAYEVWRQSKHARALDSLLPPQQKDARCLSCHAPALRRDGVEHVTCETCHGGGQYYASSFVMKDPELSRLVGLQDPSEKACRACHDASSPSLHPFKFVEKLKLIDHWTTERRKRAEAARPPSPPKSEPKKKK